MNRIRFNPRSACSLGIVSLFLLFLASSAPHRVHHLFENLPLSHETSGHYPPLAQLIAADAHDGIGHSHDHVDRSSQSNKQKHKHGDGEHHHHAPVPQPNDDSGEISPGSWGRSCPVDAGDDEHQPSTPASSASDCIAYNVAQNSHLSSVQPSAIALLVIEFETHSHRQIIEFSSFNASPFTQRAPPKA